ncbi:cytochrome P450 [Pleomassaria siparia CBS 279.74]|uniref:Cytochrome P450 n=1 Tax=Pleomassaria siparia CBS 279.74 TaxID=1314801 RepID=A0A6G1KBW4_9PLEO|nr:cytochrome P450 [Pleomassaria siparia CBS 279.74]
MATLIYAFLTLTPLVAWYVYTQLHRWRFQKYSHLPKMFPQSLLFGHLKDIAQGLVKLGDHRRHADYVAEQMFKDAGYPQMIFLDLRPVNYPLMYIASHDIAEQITRSSKSQPVSVQKSPTMQEGMGELIGKHSILSADGAIWKGLRKRYNPGFSPQHLISLLPQILEKTSTFIDKLDALAEARVDFDMDPLCTSLTFDIIGTVVTNLDFKAQDSSGGQDIVRHFRELNNTFSDTWSPWLRFNVLLRLRRTISSYKADWAIKRCIKEKWAELKQAQGVETKKMQDRSVLALSLKDTDELTPDLLQSTTDQVKSFMFAGHDTTSVLLQRLFYALSMHPKCLAMIRAEHDAVFGDSDPQQIMLSRPDETMNLLSYTSACIKEALRLWPPAASARLAPRGTGFKVQTENGEEVCLDGVVLYICHYLIHRDPKVYGETANDFVPERWLGDTSTTSSAEDEVSNDIDTSKTPIAAWRPFERGPRNCVGQELANIEARVILACVMRRYDFIKVGAGEIETDEKGRPVVDEKGMYKTKSELFNKMVITSKPFDSCRMRIKRRQPVS